MPDHTPMKRLAPFAASVAASLVLAACSVGPDYHAPASSPAPQLSAPEGVSGFSNDTPVTQFWTVFGDTTLTALEGQALQQNHDLRIALANLNAARALRREAFFDFLPTVTGQAGHVESLPSADQYKYLSRDQRETSLYSAGFDATWELDIFGRVRRENESARASEQALQADLADVQNSVAAEVASAYFELRGSQQRLLVARQNADNQQQTLDYVQARVSAGRGTDFDTERARAQLDATRASIPQLQAGLAADEHRLAVLCGQAPDALHAQLAAVQPLPELPHLVALGKPEDLLRRRPDVRAAERRLAAANAQIGVQTASLFPIVTFNGEVGFSVHNLSAVGNAGSETYSFGPNISWAAFDLGHVRARIQNSRAQTDAALAHYQKTVLGALEDTENALERYGRGRQREVLLDSAMHSSEHAAELARLRFEDGATDFLDELDAERSQLQAEDQLAVAQTEVATSLVALYKALDGGWQPAPPALAAR